MPDRQWRGPRRRAGWAQAFDRASQVFGHGDGWPTSQGHPQHQLGPARLPGLGQLPRNVADVCTWTWACAAPPRGPNKHPNTAGYAVIARAFLTAYQR